MVKSHAAVAIERCHAELLIAGISRHANLKIDRVTSHMISLVSVGARPLEPKYSVARDFKLLIVHPLRHHQAAIQDCFQWARVPRTFMRGVDLRERYELAVASRLSRCSARSLQTWSSMVRRMRSLRWAHRNSAGSTSSSSPVPCTCTNAAHSKRSVYVPRILSYATAFPRKIKMTPSWRSAFHSWRDLSG